MSTLVFSLIESLIILPAHLAHVEKPNPTGTGIISRRVLERYSGTALGFANLQVTALTMEVSE